MISFNILVSGERVQWNHTLSLHHTWNLDLPMHQPGCSVYNSIMLKQLQIFLLGTFGPAQCKGVSLQWEAEALGENFYHHDLNCHITKYWNGWEFSTTSTIACISNIQIGENSALHQRLPHHHWATLDHHGHHLHRPRLPLLSTEWSSQACHRCCAGCCLPLICAYWGQGKLFKRVY